MSFNYFINRVPIDFYIGIFLDVENGSFNKYLVFTRFTLTLSSILFCSWSLTQETAFSKLHDLLYFLMVMSHELATLMTKQSTLDLVQFLLKPVNLLNHNPEYILVMKEYTRSIQICGILMTSFMLQCSFWSLTPLLSISNLVEPSTNKFFNLPLNWIQNSTASIAVNTTASVVCMTSIFFGLLHVLCWYPALLYSIAKIRLKIKILSMDIINLNKRADILYHSTLDSLMESDFIVRLCFKCHFNNNSYQYNCQVGSALHYLSHNSERLCRNCPKEIVLEDCYKVLSKEAAMQHLDIIKLVHLVDNCFRMTILLYIQFGILFPVLVIPSLGSVTDLSVTEGLYGLTEVGGVAMSIGVMNLCGQVVLNESERLRQSLYQCRWEDAPASVKRNLLVMQTMATNGLHLTAGSMYPLSMESYKNIMRAAYSYASLFQSLQEK